MDLSLLADADDSSAILSPDLMSQENQLARRRAVLQQAALDAARQNGVFATPQAPEASPSWNSAVTGTHIGGQTLKTPTAALATPLIATLGNEFAQHRFDADQSGYNRLQQAAAQDHMSKRPADDALDSDKLKWANEGMSIPSLAPIMKSYISNQIVQGETRKEARAARKEDLEVRTAEARRKQKEDLEYKRDRDAQQEQLRRDLAADSNDLRRTLTAAIHGGGAGGDKASNYQIVQDNDGNITRVNKLTGEALPVGAGGKTSAATQKDALETRGQIERSTAAINSAPQVSKLIDQSTGSGIGAGVDAAGRVIGYATPGAKAIKQLEPLADVYLKSVPRFEGPQSDKDTASYKAAAGNLADPNLPRGERQAALKIVVQLHQKAVEQARARGNAPAASSGNLRDDIKRAAKQSASVDSLVDRYDPK